LRTLHTSILFKHPAPSKISLICTARSIHRQQLQTSLNPHFQSLAFTRLKKNWSASLPQKSQVSNSIHPKKREGLGFRLFLFRLIRIQRQGFHISDTYRIFQGFLRACRGLGRMCVHIYYRLILLVLPCFFTPKKGGLKRCLFLSEVYDSNVGFSSLPAIYALSCRLPANVFLSGNHVVSSLPVLPEVPLSARLSPHPSKYWLILPCPRLPCKS